MDKYNTAQVAKPEEYYTRMADFKFSGISEVSDLEEFLKVKDFYFSYTVSIKGISINIMVPPICVVSTRPVPACDNPPVILYYPIDDSFVGTYLNDLWGIYIDYMKRTALEMIEENKYNRNNKTGAAYVTENNKYNVAPKDWQR